MMTIDEAILNRHSVRSFTGQPLSAEVVNSLNACIDACNTASGLHLQLVLGDPEAFGRSLMARYGSFRNVHHYLCLVGPKSRDTSRLIGYFGEEVVLRAQQLGLNSCWVGLSYNKRRVHCQVASGEALAGVIALGYGTSQGVAHKNKDAATIFGPLSEAPDWYRRGAEYALLAPTAMNQQKFRFNYLPDNTVQARPGSGFYTEMDLGIAQRHFEIGAGKENFRWELA